MNGIAVKRSIANSCSFKTVGEVRGTTACATRLAWVYNLRRWNDDNSWEEVGMLRRCTIVLGVGLLLLAASAQGGGQKDESPSRTPDVVYVPTPNDVVAKMLQLAQVKKGDVVYDLGCGDARILVTAAKRYGCRGVGFEIHPGRAQFAHDNVKKNGIEHLVEIREQDIFTADLAKASVVTLYLLPELNVRLIPQLDKMAPGSRVRLARIRHGGRSARENDRREFQGRRRLAPPLLVDGPAQAVLMRGRNFALG